MSRTAGSTVVRTILAIGFLALIAASCTSSTPGPETDDETTMPLVQPAWLLVGEDDVLVGMDALLAGTFEIDIPDRCVRVTGSNLIQPVPVVFPFGTRLTTGGNPQIVLPNGRRISSGDQVEIPGGGVLERDLSSSDGFTHLSVPASCWDSDASAERFVWVVNPFSVW